MNSLSGLRTQNAVPEFVTTASETPFVTSTTTERHFNKPILIMTSDRPSRPRPKPFEKVIPKKTPLVSPAPGGYFGQIPVTEGVSERPHFDYDYYDENDDQFLGKIRAQVSDQEGNQWEGGMQIEQNNHFVG